MRKYLIKWLVGLVIVTVIILVSIQGSRYVEESRKDTIAKAVKQAALQCYTVEGYYPSNLEYLIEHYGLMVNQNRYIISYQSLSSNEMPVIQVLVRGQ